MAQSPITTPAEARRLAHLIAHDVLLYNGPKIDAAIAADNLFEAIAHELHEGRLHYHQRLAPGLDDGGQLFLQAIVDVIVASRAAIVSPVW